MQKVQNFEQPRDKKGKVKKNITFKIAQLEDANFILQKIEEDDEPVFEIQKLENYEKISNKKKKNKKKRKPTK